MVDLAPFRGVRFSPHVPPEKGISPPYDAIDAELHRRLLSHHEKNSVRWTLGEDPENPTADHDEYVERGARIRHWIQEGTLMVEDQPALYRYTLEYTGADGTSLTYRGLCGALAAGPWRESGVHPHEETKPHVVEDRLQLLMASKVDMGVVHLVNRDPEKSLTALVQEAPAQQLFSGDDFAGNRHSLERIIDAPSVAAIRARLADLDLVVADGHHRFTTFIESARRGEMGGGDRVLVTIADLDQPGMVIRPTHRVLVWPAGTAIEPAIARLQEALGDSQGVAWCLENAQGQRVAMKTVRDLEKPCLARRLAEVVATLDPKPIIENWHDAAAARLRMHASADTTLLCELPAITKEEFWERASKKQEIFPPKTTWFEPKCPSGVLARLLGADSGG